MAIEEEALESVKNALTSINVVMKSWPTIDDGTKSKYAGRFDKLKNWKMVLERWHNDFLKSNVEERSGLLIELNDIGLQMGS